MVIEIEDEETWPEDIVRLLRKNLDVLKNAQSIEVASFSLPCIEREMHGKNYKEEFDNIVEDINSKMAGCNVVGYHCTRLLNYEIEEIGEFGFKLPSRGLLQIRLQKAQENGIISQDLVDSVLIKNEYLQMPARESRLYFVCGISALQDANGIYKFFKCWGGEAVFNSHEQSEHRDTLFTIGDPIIIKTKIMPKYGMNIGLRLVFSYLKARNIPTEDSPVFDHCIEQPMPKDRILKIVHFNDPEFLKITKYRSWAKEFQPAPNKNTASAQKKSG